MNKLNWIDVGHENRALGKPEAVTGVLYRSEDGAWQVAQDDLRKSPDLRRWVIWDCRGSSPRLLLTGVSFPTMGTACAAAEALASSKWVRLRAGLKATWRAHLSSLLSSVRGVLAAEVDR